MEVRKNENIIAVGIPTDGEPVLEKRGEVTLLRNMRIGLGFHWERSVEALLPGEIEISSDPVYRVINRLPIERYLECVVGSEMNPEAPVEFLKAHAVISRSWALGKLAHTHSDTSEGKIRTPDLIVDWEDTCDHTGFDVCSDDHCQRYQGLQPVPAPVLKAIRATRGEVLRAQDGRLIDARFSKCCGGRTERFSSCWQDREEPSLESFEDPWCDLRGLAPESREEVLSVILKDYDLGNGGGYDWSETVSGDVIRRNLKSKYGLDLGEIKDLEVASRGESGRATCLKITGSRGSVEVGKELTIRRLLSPTCLYSSRFEVKRLPDAEGDTRFFLRGRGWGHGVGLCQIGAARMALSGYDYRQILSFYYPGSHTKIHD